MFSPANNKDFVSRQINRIYFTFLIGAFAAKERAGLDTLCPRQRGRPVYSYTRQHTRVLRVPDDRPGHTAGVFCAANANARHKIVLYSCHVGDRLDRERRSWSPRFRLRREVYIIH